MNTNNKLYIYTQKHYIHTSDTENYSFKALIFNTPKPKKSNTPKTFSQLGKANPSNPVYDNNGPFLTCETHATHGAPYNSVHLPGDRVYYLLL